MHIVPGAIILSIIANIYQSWDEVGRHESKDEPAIFPVRCI